MSASSNSKEYARSARRTLAVVMDPYTRRILTWRRTAAVTSAVLARVAGCYPARGVIFHSDRGSEYMGAAFCACVARLGMEQSASVRGPRESGSICEASMESPLNDSVLGPR